MSAPCTDRFNKLCGRTSVIMSAIQIYTQTTFLCILHELHVYEEKWSEYRTLWDTSPEQIPWKRADRWSGWLLAASSPLRFSESMTDRPEDTVQFNKSPVQMSIVPWLGCILQCQRYITLWMWMKTWCHSPSGCAGMYCQWCVSGLKDSRELKVTNPY